MSARLDYEIRKARYDRELDISREDLRAAIDTSYIGSCLDVDTLDYQIYLERQQEEKFANEFCSQLNITKHEVDAGVKDATHDTPAAGRSLKASTVRPSGARKARKTRYPASMDMDSSSDESDSEGSTFSSPMSSPYTSRESSPTYDILYEDPISESAQNLAVFIATCGMVNLEDRWASTPEREVDDSNAFLRDADWYIDQDRKDDEFFTIYGDNGSEERINMSAEERRKERRASQQARSERVAKAKTSAPYARPAGRQSARQRCSSS